MTRPKLEQLYNGFWLKYSTEMPEYIDRRPLRESPFLVQQLNKDEFEISIDLDFKRLKFKSSSHRTKDIAVRIRGNKRCIYDKKDNSKLTQSNVKINYFRFEETSKKTKLILIESLHYDYENNSVSLFNHPIFHCQSCNDYINEPFFDRECEVEVKRTFINQHLRIPTANMDMISVLLSIAADHFTTKEFRKVLNVFDNGDWHNKLPHISHYGNRFSPGNCYRSRAWYIG